MSLEAYIVDVIEGRRPGRVFLKPLSWVYRVGILLRNGCYRRGQLKSIKAPLPFVSIGNVVAGGSGKTPLVLLLAKELSKTLKVAILSRGYRSRLERENRVQCITLATPVEEGGDEPCFLKQKLPLAAVWVGKNRILSSQLAADAGAEVALLDDGMQYRELYRDVEIVVVDGRDPFGKGGYLPYGYLRDDPKRLQEADLVVVNHGNETITRQLEALTRAPIVQMRLKFSTDLKGKRVAIFCAIANPQRFVEAVKEAGAAVMAALFKPDHASFTLQEIATLAAPGLQIICTEKDAVKLPPLPENLSVLPIEAHLEIISGHEAWERLIQIIRKEVNHE